MHRLDVILSPTTQEQLRHQLERTGSHTETVRQAVDLLILCTTADGQIATGEGRPLILDH